MEQEDDSETRSPTPNYSNAGAPDIKRESPPMKASSVRGSSSNWLNGITDFPFIITTTDKGNTMIVTDSQMPGYRHHWSVHTRRPQRSQRIGLYFNERYACIKCKQQSRDTNASMFAPCISIIQLPNGELMLKTHPWTGIRPHICPGVPADESDACLLLRRKRQDIVRLSVDPKDAFDELMKEINEMPGWSEEKKERVRQLIGSRKRNDRTFNRCRLKGRRAKVDEHSPEDNLGDENSSTIDDPMTVMANKLAAAGTYSESICHSAQQEISATVSISESSSTLVQSWIESEMLNCENDDGRLSSSSVVDDFAATPTVNENLGIYALFTQPKSIETVDSHRIETISQLLDSKSILNNVDDGQRTITKSSSGKRQFVFDNYPQRRIALMFLYCGWEHDGLVAQPDLPNTIEEHIFAALIKTCLVLNRDSCQWTRCGRTDKGVSAFRQVAAVNVRSNDVNAEGVFWSMDSDPALRVRNTSEHNFVKILNGVLPRSIRIVGWAPADRDFNARFNCAYRLYTYIFPRSNIDPEAMNEGCRRLIGSHDLRNFCHIDNNKNRLEMSYVREIFDAKVDVLTKNDDDDPKYSLLRLTVKASGFLWHQIRCIVTVLYEIGSGREAPQLIDDLLDIERCPARPQYGLANELPLCLFDCSYPEVNLQWVFDQQMLASVFENLQRLWAELQVKASMVKLMVDSICPLMDSRSASTVGLDVFTMAHALTKNYVQMMKRPKCQSLEERIEKSAKKLKQNAD